MPKSLKPFARPRPASSPLKNTRSDGPKSKPNVNEEKLHDTGYIPSLAPSGVASGDLLSLLKHIRTHAFAELPERASGMNSQRIGEILRFRRALPPIVSIAHVHALSSNSTQTEREMAKLMAAGHVRKLTIPGRGKGGGAIGEGVVLAEDWKCWVRNEAGLGPELKDKYLRLIHTYRTSPTAPAGSFSDHEIRQLLLTGFLTFPAALSSTGAGGILDLPGAPSLLAITTAGSVAATGSLEAIGGQGAIQESGGGGSTLASKRARSTIGATSAEMTFSLPGTGAYLKLLVEARQHVLRLLKQLSPRHKEATWNVLKEKWEGNTLNNTAASQAKRRGEFNGVLAGRTKMFTQFYGLQYEWIVAECVGSGLIECFDTGAVGLALRSR